MRRELPGLIDDLTLGRKVDPISVDARLMTMLEVAYQIRDPAQVLVGSEEVEPGADSHPRSEGARENRPRGDP